MAQHKLFQLITYVPETHLEAVKQALFHAGAGRYKNYDHCCWQTLGQGQFRPLENSHPHIGQTNQLEIVPEYKIELMVTEEYLQSTLDALKQSHPYEEPAYGVVEVFL